MRLSASKVSEFKPWSRRNWVPKGVKYLVVFVALFILDYNVSRVVYVGVIVLFLRIPAFGYSL